jgi:hypothetical protein
MRFFLPIQMRRTDLSRSFVAPTFKKYVLPLLKDPNLSIQMEAVRFIKYEMVNVFFAQPQFLLFIFIHTFLI